MSGTEEPGGPREVVKRALTAAARWRLAGLLFERPRAGWVEELSALAGEARDPRLAAAARDAGEATEGAYLRLLGPGGAVSPREVAWRGREDPGRILADLTGFYEAFAFHPRAEDPPDHASVEAGFVGYLCLKEAFALAGGDEESARLAAGAREQFLREHLGPFAGPLAARLAETECGRLARAARLLAEMAADKSDPEGAAGGERGQDRQ